MKIAVLGTRGFPGVQGGVETHCENLYPRLAKLGCEVTVFTRRPYVDPEIRTYKGVKLVAIDCPKAKSLEAIVHTFKGTFAAAKIKPDILHIHGIGPSILAPMARLLGLKAVMTNHGPDYKRKKWGILAKSVLMLGECLGSLSANKVISISEFIAKNVEGKYKRGSYVIPNGIEIPEIVESEEALRKYSLTRQKYILAVGRFVPEKGFNDLVDAFNEAELNDWKLVVAGRADHESEYSRRLEKNAVKSRNVILTGFISGKPLEELYSQAGIFVLPSYYEGLPIALLEAMSYGLLCLASDIPGNREVDLSDANYFPVANISVLSGKLKQFTRKSLSASERFRQIATLRQKYDWDKIAQDTFEVYKKLRIV